MSMCIMSNFSSECCWDGAQNFSEALPMIEQYYRQQQQYLRDTYNEQSNILNTQQKALDHEWTQLGQQLKEKKKAFYQKFTNYLDILATESSLLTQCNTLTSEQKKPYTTAVSTSMVHLMHMYGLQHMNILSYISSSN